MMQDCKRKCCLFKGRKLWPIWQQTLFRNESNLHTKITFTHNISRWTHHLMPEVSLSAVQWSTNSIFTVLAEKKLKHHGQIMLDAAKLISLVSSPLGRGWERGQLSSHGWRARNFWSYKLCLTSLPVRRTVVAALVFFVAIIRRDGESPPKFKKYADGPHESFFSYNKDAVNFEAACCGQGLLEF